jgi:hypothetical protein
MERRPASAIDHSCGDEKAFCQDHPRVDPILLGLSPLVPSLGSTVDHLFVPTCRYPKPSCRAAVKDGRRADLDTRSRF